MQIQLNGEPYEVEAPTGGDGVTLGLLIEALGLGGRRLAVEVNQELVPRSEHACFGLATGDRVEIVQAIGGG